MAERLPLFPLNVVLFPGTPLPLHIFEPRYRRLVADCLAGDERFGLVCPAPDGAAPAAGAVGCRGRIRAVEPLPDGRSHIVLVGETRFTLQRYASGDEPYFVGWVDPWEDSDLGYLPSAEQRQRLQTLYRGYLEALAQLNDTALTSFDQPDDPADLAWQIAALPDLDLSLKQTLLASRSLERRIDLLLDRFPALVQRAAELARRHGTARSNGQGTLV